MSNQELLTFLFNAIALGFLTIAGMDFGTRLLTTYKQVNASSSLLSATERPIDQLPMATASQKLSQLPDPWLLPLLEGSRELPPVKLIQTEQNHLRLLPPAKSSSIAITPRINDLLLGVNVDTLKLRQARKIAKVLGIAQKVNGRDQKLDFLRSQIKLKLQQAKSEIIEVVKQELLAS